MRNSWIAALLIASLSAQTARFPTSIATDRDLTVQKDRGQSTLTGAMTSSATSFTVVTGSKFVANQIVTVDNEQILTCSVVGNTVSVGYSACPNVDGRGYAGTTAASHTNSSLVSGNVVSWNHNALGAEVKAIEVALGVNLANIPNGQQLSTSDYIFTAQTPGGSIAAGSNVISMAPCPAGVNGTDLHHYLYVSAGTGTAEPVLITGGTCTAGATSGTVIVTASNAHSGAWTIQSATHGLQEAIQAALSLNPTSPPQVNIPGGYWQMYGTLYIPPFKDFRIDSANAVMEWPVGFGGDKILIDSCEDCDYRLPLMMTHGTGNPVHLFPANPDPSGLTAFVDSRLFVADINADRGIPGTSDTIFLADTSVGSIDLNDIYIGGSTSAKYGFLVQGANGFTYNRITLPDMSENTIVQVQDSAASQKNTWEIRLKELPGTAVGASINGRTSEWHIANGNQGTGVAIAIQSGACYNQIFASGIDGGWSNASTCPNRIFTLDLEGSFATLGFTLSTPAVPASGTPIVNTNPTPVIITFLTAGTGPANFTIHDIYGTGQTTASTIAQGQQAYLNPGEGLHLNYGGAPTWQWRAVQ